MCRPKLILMSCHTGLLTVMEEMLEPPSSDHGARDLLCNCKIAMLKSYTGSLRVWQAVKVTTSRSF